MKNNVFITITLLCLGVTSIAQVVIGTDNPDTDTPNAAAILEIKSTDKGILLPRLESSKISDLDNVKGLMVYCTNCDGNKGVLKINNGSEWLDYVPASGGTFSGNVGIGTDDPQYKLDILENSKNGVRIRSGDEKEDIAFSVGSASTSDKFVITAGGNVSIGSNDNIFGGYKFLVAAKENFFNSTDENRTVLSIYNPFIEKGDNHIHFGLTDVTNRTYNFIRAHENIFESNIMKFKTGTANTERMRINTDGDISFYEDTGTTAKFFWDASSKQLTSDKTILTHSLSNNSAVITSTTGNLEFRGSGDDYKQFFLEDGGNVGIGTDDPQALLHLKKNVGETIAKAEVLANSIVGFAIKKNSDDTDQEWLIADGATKNGVLEIYDKTDNRSVMSFDSDGNVMMGTTNSTPARSNVKGMSFTSGRLEVSQIEGPSGDFNRDNQDGEIILFRRSGNQVGDITVTTNGTSYNISSDYRLKEDWRPIENASDRLMQLNPVNFAWKSNGSRIDGFLAHQVDEVVPNAVTGKKDGVDKDGNPKYQRLDHSKLVPILTAALQDALERIEALEQQLKN